MDTLLTSPITLLQMMCVIIVVACLHTRSRIFPQIHDGHPIVNVQILLVLKVM
jgi:hypothetical protein